VGWLLNSRGLINFEEVKNRGSLMAEEGARGDKHGVNGRGLFGRREQRG